MPISSGHYAYYHWIPRRYFNPLRLEARMPRERRSRNDARVCERAKVVKEFLMHGTRWVLAFLGMVLGLVGMSVAYVGDGMG